MQNFEHWARVEFTAGVSTVAVPNGFFSRDNKSAKLGIRCFYKSEPYIFTNTQHITWFAKNSDGVTRSDSSSTTCTVTVGTNEAYVELPEAALVVGPITVALRLEESPAKQVVAVFTGYVHETATAQEEVPPWTPVPDIQELMAEIATMEAVVDEAQEITQEVSAHFPDTGRFESGSGQNTDVTAGNYTAAIGRDHKTTGSYSAAMGYGNTASGNHAVSLGKDSTAKGYASQTQGIGLVANGFAQHVSGAYNVADTGGQGGDDNTKGQYVEIVGNGNGINSRSNARTLDWNGNEVLAGSLTIGGDEQLTKAQLQTMKGLDGRIGNTVMGTTATTVTGAIAEHESDLGVLKRAIVDGLASETMDGWEKGGFNTTNGDNYTDNTRIRNQTKVGYSTGVYNFKLNIGYSTLMYAWDINGNYVGAYKTDGTWSKAASNWKSVTEFDLSTVPNYVVKFAITRTTSSSDISASEGNQLVMYKLTDSGFTQENKAADAKAVGKLASTVDCIKGLAAENVNFGWLQSTDIYSDSGNDRDNRPTRSRSGYILLPKGAKLTVTPSPWYIQWYRYNGTTKAWIDASSFTAAWTNSEFSLKYDDADYYFRFVVRDANADANVTAANITVVGKMQYPIVSSVIQNTNNINSLLENDGFKIVTPRFLRICGGIEQNIYYQNILQGLNAKEAYEVKASAFATNYNDFARLSKGDTASETHGFRVNVYPHNSSKYIESQTIDYKIVPKSSGSGLSKKVLIIGDSLTYNQPLTKHLVDNLLTNDVMTVELIGTLGAAPYLREGRPGWGAYTYTHEASHTSDSGSTFTNAFWNPSTEKFDFSYYMTNNGFSGVDYVFINLGTNDFGRATADIITDLTEIITSIHAYSSDIRIGVWSPPPRSLTGYGSLVNRDVILAIANAIYTAFNWEETNKIYVVPVTLNVDPYHDFPMESVYVSAENHDYQMLVTTDKVHPSNAGYAKMADMIYSYIKYFGSLDAT